jgi:hypothetical protein
MDAARLLVVAILAALLAVPAPARQAQAQAPPPT